MTIPRKELVGRNSRLENEVYLDDYMTALNEFATVDEVFGNQREAITNRHCSTVASLVMGTLGKAEHEFHLASIVMNAAKAGEWRAVVREPGKHYDGLDNVEHKGFGYVVDHEDKKFLLPTALYVTYCQRKLDR